MKKEEIRIEKRLGKGNFGEVYLVKWQGALVVLKKLVSDNNNGDAPNMDAALREIRREAERLAAVSNHPHIISLVGFCQEEKALLTSYAKYGSIEDAIIKENMLSKNKDFPKILQVFFC